MIKAILLEECLPLIKVLMQDKKQVMHYVLKGILVFVAKLVMNSMNFGEIIISCKLRGNALFVLMIFQRL